MKKEDMNQTIPSGGVPLAIIGIGCLFPQADDQTATGPISARGSMPSPISRPPTGALQITMTRTRKPLT